jgi:hypothetical protein
LEYCAWPANTNISMQTVIAAALIGFIRDIVFRLVGFYYCCVISTFKIEFNCF